MRWVYPSTQAVLTGGRVTASSLTCEARIPPDSSFGHLIKIHALRCYAVNLLCLVYVSPTAVSSASVADPASQLWILPGNPYLFEACFGLTLGTLGSAIATWRNSLVFHSMDKVRSCGVAPRACPN